MKTEAEALEELEKKLDDILLAKKLTKPLDVDSYPASFRASVEKINTLCEHLHELNQFTMNVSQGELSIEPPGRKNLLAGPVKEIHSQLISFCYSIEQLVNGNMVSKLYYPGELFSSYNTLIEKVSQTFSTITSEPSEKEWGQAVSSWRYHQILSAINQLHIMVLEVDAKGGILFANPPAQDVLSSYEALPYDEPEENLTELLKYLCKFKEKADNLRPDKIYSKEFPAWAEIYDSETGAWYKITSDTVNLADGNVGILHVIDDISDWKKQESQLKLSANIDTMTSTYTRKAGYQKLEELVWLRKEQQNCVAFIDLDGLKEINDHYGHNEGDLAIASVADIMLSCVRKTDWVVRFGGDEFLVLFMNCPKELAWEVIDRMYVKLDELNQRQNKPYTLSFSVGVTAITDEMQTTADVIAVADQNMYTDKVRRKALMKAEKEKQNA